MRPKLDYPNSKNWIALIKAESSTCRDATYRVPNCAGLFVSTGSGYQKEESQSTDCCPCQAESWLRDFEAPDWLKVDI